MIYEKQHDSFNVGREQSHLLDRIWNKKKLLVNGYWIYLFYVTHTCITCHNNTTCSFVEAILIKRKRNGEQ